MQTVRCGQPLWKHEVQGVRAELWLTASVPNRRADACLSSGIKHVTTLTGTARTCAARKEHSGMIATTCGVPSVSCVTNTMKDTGMPLIKNAEFVARPEGNVAVDACRFTY